MKAMTWWDHETESIWAQPWGAAIAGALAGARLDLLPAEIRTLGSWTDRHQDSLVLVVEGTEDDRLFHKITPVNFFVIGVTINDAAAAYRFADIADARVINDSVGTEPIALFVVPGSDGADVFLATPRGYDEPLTFLFEKGAFFDEQTRTIWDPATGEGTSGPLKGNTLERVAHASAYDWAWEDFFPRSRLYEPTEGQ